MTTLSTLIDSEGVSFQSNTIHNTLLADELRQSRRQCGDKGFGGGDYMRSG